MIYEVKHMHTNLLGNMHIWVLTNNCRLQYKAWFYVLYNITHFKELYIW